MELAEALRQSRENHEFESKESMNEFLKTELENWRRFGMVQVAGETIYLPAKTEKLTDETIEATDEAVKGVRRSVEAHVDPDAPPNPRRWIG